MRRSCPPPGAITVQLTHCQVWAQGQQQDTDGAAGRRPERAQDPDQAGLPPEGASERQKLFTGMFTGLYFLLILSPSG